MEDPIGIHKVIILKDLDRPFEGDIARVWARSFQPKLRLPMSIVKAPNGVKKEQGRLEAAHVQAQTKQQEANADAYTVVAAAKGTVEALEINRADSGCRCSFYPHWTTADKDIEDPFAREMNASGVEVSRVQACGNRAMFIPAESGAGIKSSIALGSGWPKPLSASRLCNEELWLASD
ncbi:hypothetical protein FRC17_009570, partial [Serendipita sp. 399]